MLGLTGKHLEDLAKKHCKQFLGVFSCNMHPKIKNNNNFSIIFNESKNDEEGTHFVCLHANKNVLYYFDSLGLKCENEYIKEFLNSTQRDVIEIGKQIQSFESIFCGYFCLSFILYMSVNSKSSIQNYLNLFSVNNLKLNDKIVVELILELLK